MPSELSRCKITVVKITLNRDLVDEYLDVSEEFRPCECFQLGQEFVVEQTFGMPEGFCPWAWADLRGPILSIATGANKPWMKQPGTDVAGCTDWFRPVYFEIERID